MIEFLRCMVLLGVPLAKSVAGVEQVCITVGGVVSTLALVNIIAVDSVAVLVWVVEGLAGSTVVIKVRD